MDSFRPFAARARRGRFREETNFELYLGGRLVGVVKAFAGRPPYYGPWVEVFNLDPRLVGTDLERHLFCVLYRHMESGEVLYVEYIHDGETYFQLQRGVLPGRTRLGAVLEACGFEVVKDWYFPEGWLEGGPKLQAVRR